MEPFATRIADSTRADRSYPRKMRLIRARVSGDQCPKGENVRFTKLSTDALCSANELREKAEPGRNQFALARSGLAKTDDFTAEFVLNNRKISLGLRNDGKYDLRAEFARAIFDQYARRDLFLPDQSVV
jgi:hypothetical protein